MSCRLWIDPTRLRSGPLEIDGPNEHHYLFRVRRLATGDRVTLFDGEGREAPAIVEAVTATCATLAVGDVVTGLVARGPRISMLVSLIKGPRMERCIEKLTELSASAIIPVAAARSVVKLDGQRESRRRQRLEAVAESAARQCGRADLPAIAPVTALTDAIDAAPADALKLILVTSPDAPLLKDALPAFAAEAWVLSGPEGGFSAGEVSRAQHAGFLPVSLGPLTLRADTAPVAALALLGHML